jgi:peptidyl-dipeptidase Dcp
MTNPFTDFFENQSFNTVDDSVPFFEITEDIYLPSLKAAIDLANERLEALRHSTSEPTFENTCLALELLSDELDQVVAVFHNQLSGRTTTGLQKISQEFFPILSSFQSDIYLDANLFRRVQIVYNSKSPLQTEDRRLSEKQYQNFVRNGALLKPVDKEELRAIDQKLSVLSPQFSDNVTRATNAFEMYIQSKDDLAGLTDNIIEAAAEAAAEKGKKGQYLITLHMHSFIPFMQYSKNRELRKRLYLAYNTRCTQGEFDNTKNIFETVRLRHRRAQLLGFKSHAEFVLADRMAKTPDEVFAFLKKFEAPALKSARKDLSEVQQIAQELDGVTDLSPWDWAYYSEKLKRQKYNFDAEALRPYLKLENVLNGVFEHARRLFDLEFFPVNVQSFHPDVKSFEVRSKTSKEYIGLLYLDLFPRSDKRSGAWMSTLREQGMFFGEVRRPHVTITCNFTKPVGNKPVLLDIDEVYTIFHEFGHALHGLLSKCTYRSIAGTNVKWDFVELPSQLMENWVRQRESLDLFARHFETNETMPESLFQGLKASNLFQIGSMNLRQLTFSLIDMAWHSGAAVPNSVSDLEDATVGHLRIFPKIPGTLMSNGFQHIFAGGYSAGYYSYKWAEVLEADAFSYFEEKGIFSSEVATKYKDNILTRGDSEEPMELYLKFRGRKPQVEALLERDGLT